MSKISEAADEGRKLVKMLNSVQIVIETLDEIGSAENLLAEVNGRLAQAQELEAAEVKKREAIIASANAVVANAKEEAGHIVAEARNVSTRAHEEAREARDKVASLHVDAAKASSKASAQMQAAKNALEVINETIKVREVELAAINSNIAEAKATIEKMLKG